jgi:hypothetical protein
MPPKKHSRRQPAEDHATYLVAIEDWDWSFSFGVNQGRHRTDPYWDCRHLNITGQLLQPKRVKAERAALYCMPDVHLNHAYRQDDEPNTTGSLTLHNGVLQALLPIPQDALDSLLQMLAARRFRYAVLTGGRLRYRKALVRMLRFETRLDEEDFPADDDG